MSIIINSGKEKFVILKPTQQFSLKYVGEDILYILVTNNNNNPHFWCLNRYLIFFMKGVNSEIVWLEYLTFGIIWRFYWNQLTFRFNCKDEIGMFLRE